MTIFLRGGLCLCSIWWSSFKKKVLWHRKNQLQCSALICDAPEIQALWEEAEYRRITEYEFGRDLNMLFHVSLICILGQTLRRFACKDKSTSSGCTLVWQKAMAEIVLLLPKAENVLMYYRRGETKKNHIQVEFHCLWCVFGQLMIPCIWRT